MGDTQRLFCEYCVQEFNSADITPSYAAEPANVTDDMEAAPLQEEKQNRCPDCKRRLVTLRS